MADPIVVRVTNAATGYPIGSELGYRTLSDAILILGEGNFDVIREQDGDPITPPTPEELDEAQQAALAAYQARRIIRGAEFDAPGSVTREKLAADVAAGISLNVKQYGAVGDGTTDDTAAIQAAYADIEEAGGGTMFFPATTDSYLIDTALTIVATVPLVIDLNGQSITRNPSVLFTISGEVMPTALTLSVAVARGDKELTLTSAATVQPGDLLDVFEAVPAETTQNTNRRATYNVQSVDGNVVTLSGSSNMVFSASASISHYRSQHPVIIQNGTLHFALTPVSSQSLLQLSGLHGAIVNQVRLTSDQEWIAGGPLGTGIITNGCSDTMFTSVYAEGISYGINPNGGSQNTLITTMTAHNVRHPVVPAGWANGVIVAGLATSNCYQSIDAHASFDVHYSNVFASRDETFPNLRTVGGSITNAHVVTDALDADAGPFYHSIVLADLSWYDTADLLLRDVTILSPDRAKATVGAVYGRVVCENLVAASGAVTDSPVFQNTLESLRITNCRNPDGSAWSRKVSRIATRSNETLLPAVLDTGVYRIDPHATLIDSHDGLLRTSGTILRGSTTDPVAISIRVLDNAFPEVDYPTIIFGRITLTAFVRHNNAGGFDSLVHTYDFYHRVQATSSLFMPLTPSFVSALTGQANESLAIAVTNPTQAGATELGVVYPASWFQFDVAITSGRTVPVYNLAYDLELHRG